MLQKTDQLSYSRGGNEHEDGKWYENEGEDEEDLVLKRSLREWSGYQLLHRDEMGEAD